MSKSSSFGKLILFGSGETSEAGKRIHRKIFQTIPQLAKIAILETPAGFQPNSKNVAKEIASVFNFSLKEFVSSTVIVPARKKGTDFSPDNPSLLKLLDHADYIFLGPGSPTYAVSQLKRSLALKLMLKKWKHGTTLCLSSAAAIAAGKYTLPVYEIYKAGADLYWEKGLNILNLINFPGIVITHWNNTEGGKYLDTSRGFMGKERFLKLTKLLPEKTPILGIDEHSAIVFDFSNNCFLVEGVGGVTLKSSSKEVKFMSGKCYSLDSLSKIKVIETKKPEIKKTKKSQKMQVKKTIKISLLPKNIQQLLLQREEAKKKKDFKTSDILRNKLFDLGYKVEDFSDGSQKIYKYF